MIEQNLRRSIVSAKAKGLSGKDKWAVKQQHRLNAIICPKYYTQYYTPLHVLPQDWEPLYNITSDESAIKKEYCCSRFIESTAEHYSCDANEDWEPSKLEMHIKMYPHHN
jgi:hypothetical protein